MEYHQEEVPAQGAKKHLDLLLNAVRIPKFKEDFH